MLIIAYILIISQIVLRIRTHNLYEKAKHKCDHKRSRYERLQEKYYIPASDYDAFSSKELFPPSNENIKAQYLEEYQQLVRSTCDEETFADVLKKSAKKVSKENKCLPLIGSCNKKAKYAPIGGYCNNLKNPNYGRLYSNYIHLLDASYADGISEIRKSKSKKELPSARVLGNILFNNFVPFDEPETNNVLGLFFGQLITHDISDRNYYAIKGNSAPGIRCCKKNYEGPLEPEKTNPNCIPIDIPADDGFFNETGIRCQNYIRLRPTLSNDCKITYSTENRKSSFLDLSPIYSDTEDILDTLRAKSGGRFKLDQKNILPENENGNITAGDLRVLQSPQIALLHSIFYRLHNKIAKKLARVNKKWDDDKLFFESRRIVLAIYQKIIYDEWIPLYIDAELCATHGGEKRCESDHDEYDENIDPSASVEFAHNAFRVYHRNIPSKVTLQGQKIPISDLIRKAGIIREKDNYDDLLRGMQDRGMLVNRPGYSPELRNEMFQVDYKGRKIGSDLFMLDVMRSRDSGTAPFIDFFELHYSKKVHDWDDLEPHFNELEFSLLRRQYKHPHDIDLIGGLLTEPRKKNTLGPIGSTIVADQFFRLKHGDRFFWSHRNNPYKFTQDQLHEIKEYTFAKLICWVTDVVEVPERGFVEPNKTTNLYVPCDQLKQIDFHVFRD